MMLTNMNKLLSFKNAVTTIIMDLSNCTKCLGNPGEGHATSGGVKRLRRRCPLEVDSEGA